MSDFNCEVQKVGNNIIVSWPSAYLPVQLQQATVFTKDPVLVNTWNGNWSNVGGPTMTTSKTLLNNGQQSFFRVLSAVPLCNADITSDTLLTWTAPELASPTDVISDFTVYRATAEAGPYIVLATLTGTTFSYRDNGTPSPDLFYLVNGHTAQGVTIPYPIIQISESSGVPTNVNVSTSNCGPVTITWSGVSNATLYNIYRKGPADADYKILTSLTGLTFPDASVAPNTAYSYKVSAVVAGTESDKSIAANISTPTCGDTVPPSSTWISPAQGSTVSGTIDIVIQVNDNVSVGRVDINIQNLGGYITKTKYGDGTTQSIVTYTIDTTQLANGYHGIYAKSFDIAGNSFLDVNTPLNLTVSNVNLNPGTLAWANDIGISPVSGEAQCTGVCVDSAGNFIVCGKFTGTVNFSGTPKTSAGGYDCFICKFDPTGAITGLKTFGGLYDNVVNGIAVDSTGSVVLTGYTTGTFTVDGKTVTSGQGNNGPDLMVLKFNSSLVCAWGKSNFGVFGNYGNAITVNTVDYGGGLGVNDAFVCGQFNNRIDFGGGVRQGAGVTDGFVVRFKASNGDWVWDNTFGGSALDTALSIAMDLQGNPVIAGRVESPTITFNGHTFPSSGTIGGSSDGFLVRYIGSTGAYSWARLIGGPGNDAINAVAVDPNNVGVCAGTFTSSIVVDSFSFNAPQSTAMFIGQFSLTDGTFIAARAIGGTSSIGGNIGPTFVACDSSRNIVITGIATGEADFGSGQIGAGTGNPFVVKYSPSSIGYLWDKRFNNNGWSNGAGLAIDVDRNIGNAGGFAGTINFDTIQKSTVSQQIKDAYLIKIGP